MSSNNDQPRIVPSCPACGALPWESHKLGCSSMSEFRRLPDEPKVNEYGLALALVAVVWVLMMVGIVVVMRHLVPHHMDVLP